MSSEGLTLSEAIDAQIRANGPISIATYMGLCLTHPRRGYYGASDPIGAGGDFVTAPEISQMFGELIGFFLVNLWQQMREPAAFTLLELGPGRGTLLEDALRVGARAPAFIDALHLQLFEASEGLRKVQEKRLAQYHPYWSPEIDAVGGGPLLVVANEFFDALPIRQFVREKAGWHERMIGLRDGQRVFGLSPTPIPPGALPPVLGEAEIGTVYEAGPAAQDAITRLSRIVARQGGAILVIDYGYGRTQPGETLQAVRRHAYAGVLEHPGETDISAHVDFEALAAAAKAQGLIVHPLVSQGEFLRRLGIDERTASLSRANPDAASEVEAARDRLTASDKMGDLFKVLCVASPGLVPAGVNP